MQDVQTWKILQSNSILFQPVYESKLNIAVLVKVTTMPISHSQNSLVKNDTHSCDKLSSLLWHHDLILCAHQNNFREFATTTNYSMLLLTAVLLNWLQMQRSINVGRAAACCAHSHTLTVSEKAYCCATYCMCRSTQWNTHYCPAIVEIN